MPIREKIRQIKHLQNKYFICVLENPTDIVNTASAMRNVSAFGVTKLYVVGGDKNILKDFYRKLDKRINNIYRFLIKPI